MCNVTFLTFKNLKNINLSKNKLFDKNGLKKLLLGFEVIYDELVLANTNSNSAFFIVF